MKRPTISCEYMGRLAIDWLYIRVHGWEHGDRLIPNICHGKKAFTLRYQAKQMAGKAAPGCWIPTQTDLLIQDEEIYYLAKRTLRSKQYLTKTSLRISLRENTGKWSSELLLRSAIQLVPLPLDIFWKIFSYKIIVLDKTQRDLTCPNSSFTPHEDLKLRSVFSIKPKDDRVQANQM